MAGALQKEMARLNSLDDTINKQQLLFGINQGAIYSDIRIEHAKRITDLDLDGYAVGGLAVGETHEEMYHILEETVPYLPVDKPTYLMGVGTPANILEAVERGVDFLTAYIPPETDVTDIYIQTLARLICSTRSMSWICSPSSQGVNALSADGIPEPISVTC